MPGYKETGYQPVESQGINPIELMKEQRAWVESSMEINRSSNLTKRTYKESMDFSERYFFPSVLAAGIDPNEKLKITVPGAGALGGYEPLHLITMFPNSEEIKISDREDTYVSSSRSVYRSSGAPVLKGLEEGQYLPMDTHKRVSFEAKDVLNDSLEGDQDIVILRNFGGYGVGRDTVHSALGRLSSIVRQGGVLFLTALNEGEQNPMLEYMNAQSDFDMVLYENTKDVDHSSDSIFLPGKYVMGYRKK